MVFGSCFTGNSFARAFRPGPALKPPQADTEELPVNLHNLMCYERSKASSIRLLGSRKTWAFCGASKHPLLTLKGIKSPSRCQPPFLILLKPNSIALVNSFWSSIFRNEEHGLFPRGKLGPSIPSSFKNTLATFPSWRMLS
jgi:hypothetical protein